MVTARHQCFNVLAGDSPVFNCSREINNPCKLGNARGRDGKRERMAVTKVGKLHQDLDGVDFSGLTDAKG